MTFFGLKQGQDLENRAARPLQEFPGVLPLGPRFGPCLSPVVFMNFIFVYFFKDRISQLIKGTVVKQPHSGWNQTPGNKIRTLYWPLLSSVFAENRDVNWSIVFSNP